MLMAKRFLLSSYLLIGIGALIGGWTAIYDPLTPFGLSTALLAHSPFSTFLIPGTILFFVIGLGNIICLLLLFGPPAVQIYASNMVSWALLIWLVVQVWLLQRIETPHLIFFILGFFQAFFSFSLLVTYQLFPMSLASKHYKTIERLFSRSLFNGKEKRRHRK